MESRPVHLDRPPHSARLLAWGRGPFGWWGLVTFRQSVRPRERPARALPGDGVEEMSIAAWVPGSALRAPPWSSPVELPRITLADDQLAWPAPRGWPSWYAGPWVSGPLPLPPGVEVVTGPAWSRRRR